MSANIRRLMLRVAYDGTAYHGWAMQEGAVTVAGTLKEAIEGLTGEEIELEGASRTDAGVHALMNIAVFDTGSTIPPERFYAALNARLPGDIRVRTSEEVAPDFSIRRAETEKTYRYSILNSEIPDPLKRLYTCHVSFPLDVPAMDAAAQVLRGRHDFKSFCSVHTQALSTEREITAISVKRQDDTVEIRVSGYGFLYNMVRIISGTLIEVGRGRYTAKDVSRMLASLDRTAAGPTAPAQGLTLEEIRLIGDGR